MASIKGLKRMCNSYEECEGCPMSDERGDCKVQYAPCDIPDDVNEIVDKWVAEHHAKTYMQDFFEKFPNARKSRTGEPISCVEDMYSVDFGCGDDCHACWNKVMPE